MARRKPHTPEPNDQDTTVGQLRRQMMRFVARRDWRQFHDPKNLAMSIAIEAAELMEHFQWLTTAEAREAVKDRKELAQIADELADVLSFALSFANTCRIDITRALRRKMAANRVKYPTERFLGRYR